MIITPKNIIILVIKGLYQNKNMHIKIRTVSFEKISNNDVNIPPVNLFVSADIVL